MNGHVDYCDLYFEMVSQLDNAESEDFMNWYTTNVACTCSFQVGTNGFSEGYSLCGNNVQLGIHLRSNALFQLVEINKKLEIQEDEMEIDILNQLYTCLRSGGLQNLISHPGPIVMKFIQYRNEKEDTMYKELFNRYSMKVHTLLNYIKEIETKYCLQLNNAN